MEDINKISKFISLILRHKPKIIGIDIELKGGWSDTKELIEKFENKTLKGEYVIIVRGNEVEEKKEKVNKYAKDIEEEDEEE